jgi:hypothetical protein
VIYRYRKENTQTLIDASKEVGLEVNAKKTKYMLLGTTVTNQNSVQEEIKRRLNSVNACYLQSRTFCFLVYCLKPLQLEYTKL